MIDRNRSESIKALKAEGKKNKQRRQKREKTVSWGRRAF
jgi:hypothetical protein